MKAQASLSQKILFTIMMVMLYRFGSYIPLPGVDAIAMENLMKQNSSGIMGMFNMLSGGSLGRMSIFALAIMPYITSSIIIQLFSMSYKALSDMKKEGESGRKKMNQISRYLTIIIASMQALAIVSALETMQTPSGEKIVLISGLIFKTIGVMSLVVGTMLLMWLGEQVTSKGIGNGSSMIIFFGIVSEIPSNFFSSMELIRKGALPIESYALTMFVSILIMLFVIFCEKAIRKIPMHYPKHYGTGAPSMSAENSFLPIKINIAGVIPPMFADAMLRFPVTIANLSTDPSSIWGSVSMQLSRGKPLFMILYSGLIIFFCFTYTSIVFNTEEISNNFKKGNIVIGSRRPGVPTQEYLDHVVLRTTAVGAIYICLLCILPEVLFSAINLTVVGGTTMMILVNVVVDTFGQIQSYALGNRYDMISKRLKL